MKKKYCFLEEGYENSNDLKTLEDDFKRQIGGSESHYRSKAFFEGERTWTIGGSIKGYEFLKKYSGQVEINKTVCKDKITSFYKPYMIINEEKAKFCLNLYQNMIFFNPQQLIEFLPSVKNNLTRIHKYKGSFYCSICDAHSQRVFDVKTKTIGVNPQYCKAIFKKNKDYFLFTHVIFIQYMDRLMQYASCFETTGGSGVFP